MKGFHLFTAVPVVRCVWWPFQISSVHWLCCITSVSVHCQYSVRHVTWMFHMPRVQSSYWFRAVSVRCQDCVRTMLGQCQDSVRTVSGLCQDSVRHVMCVVDVSALQSTREQLDPCCVSSRAVSAQLSFPATWRVAPRETPENCPTGGAPVLLCL